MTNAAEQRGTGEQLPYWMQSFVADRKAYIDRVAELEAALRYLLAFAEETSHGGEYPHPGIVEACPFDPCRSFADARAALGKNSGATP